MTNRARPVARSQRIGLRLYAIALEPTCSSSNGSSICFIPASRRMSLAEPVHAGRRCPRASPTICASTLRGYVWPVTGNDSSKSEPLGHHRVELLDLGVVAVEEREERRLRAGRPFHAAELERGDAMLDLLQIDHQVLRPERRALADGRELRRLEVRVAERRQVLPLHRRTSPARRSRSPAAPRAASSRRA